MDAGRRRPEADVADGRKVAVGGRGEGGRPVRVEARRPPRLPRPVDQPCAAHHRPVHLDQPAGRAVEHDLGGRHGAAADVHRRRGDGPGVLADRARGDAHDRAVAVEDRRMDEAAGRLEGHDLGAGGQAGDGDRRQLVPPSWVDQSSGPNAQPSSRPAKRSPATPLPLASLTPVVVGGAPAPVQVRPPSPVWRSPRRSRPCTARRRGPSRRRPSEGHRRRLEARRDGQAGGAGRRRRGRGRRRAGWGRRLGRCRRRGRRRGARPDRRPADDGGDAEHRHDQHHETAAQRQPRAGGAGAGPCPQAVAEARHRGAPRPALDRHRGHAGDETVGSGLSSFVGERMADLLLERITRWLARHRPPLVSSVAPTCSRRWRSA